MSTETKERLDKVKHPGQSYEGCVQELLNAFEEQQRVPKRFEQPIQQLIEQPISPPPPAPTSSIDKQLWWWWPQVDKVPGKQN